jgi:hypothetical protein
MRLPFPRRHWLVWLLAAVLGSPLSADNRIHLECRINGQPVSMAIDTGADVIAIFEPVARRLGLTIVPPPADARAKAGEVLVSRTEPLKFGIQDEPPVETPLYVLAHAPYLAMDIDGLIGWENIRNNVWMLHAAERQFSRLKEIPAETAGWLKVREYRERTKLSWALPPAKAGIVRHLGVDTGADSGVRLSPAAWAEWRKGHARVPVTLEAYAMPGIGVSLIVAEQAWADEIKLGSLVLHGVVVTSANPTEMLDQAPDTLAILGLGAMLRMDTVFDGKNDLAYLNPLRTPPPKPDHNRLGAVFVPNDPRTDTDLVAHVAPGSPAAKAGVKNGDILLKIDQLDVTPWRSQPGILPLRRFFAQPADTKLQLTVRRGNKTVVCKAVLKDILGPAKK